MERKRKSKTNQEKEEEEENEAKDGFEVEAGWEYGRRKNEAVGEEGLEEVYGKWKEPVYEGKPFRKEMCDLSDEGQAARRRVRGKGNKSREYVTAQVQVIEKKLKQHLLPPPPLPRPTLGTPRG